MKRRTFLISTLGAMFALLAGDRGWAGAGKGGGGGGHGPGYGAGSGERGPHREPKSDRGQPEHMRRMEKDRDQERYRDPDAERDSSKMKTKGIDQR